MTILSALAKAYASLPGASDIGYAAQKISILVSLRPDGSIAGAYDLRSTGKKREPRTMAVPAPVKKSSNVAPNTLWDKTEYSLGVKNGRSHRTAREHAAFIVHQRDFLGSTDDPGLVAFLRFLHGWHPERWPELVLPEDALGKNVIFGLEEERLDGKYLHDRPAARALLARAGAGSETMSICLVTGQRAPVARIHPRIVGVAVPLGKKAADTLVGFNWKSFESYGHSQGENAPVSVAAAAAYTGTLNHFLQRDSGHRVQLADASTVYWADTADPVTQRIASGVLDAILTGEPPPPAETLDASDMASEAKAMRIVLERMAAGRPFGPDTPDVSKDLRYFVLGLAPNAARISIRFWMEDTFGRLAENYRRFNADMALESGGQRRPLLGLRTMSVHTAPARVDRNGAVSFDLDHVPKGLAGELVRAALTGQRFPASLLPTLVGRLRTDGVVSRIRVSLVKAAVVRAMRIEDRLPKRLGQPQEDYLVRSDPDDPSPARRLGRLFALVERAQGAALGDNVNSTVKDKYLGSAAATPGQVMPGILLNAENHLRRLRKGHSDAEWIKDGDMARRVGAGLGRDIGRLAGQFPDGFPNQHTTEEQGLFLVGYYQERFGASGKDEPEAEPLTKAEDEIS